MTPPPRHIHLSGICGAAMASLAGLLQLQGHRITGSDKAAYPPMSDLLRSLGIPVMEPYAEANLDPAPDLVVIGNALSRGNPEVERILDQRIPFTSMAALLREEFLTGRESTRRRRHAWQNHHHQHAGLDLPGRRTRKPGP